MGKITIMVGISGSGKSTLARQMQSEDSNSIIVSRDKIRELIFGYTDTTVAEYYNHPEFALREKEVTKTLNLLISDALYRGKNVIADATHLKPKYILNYKQFNVDTDIVINPIDPEVAIHRDKLRARTVGESIIRQQHEDFLKLRFDDLVGWKKDVINNDRNKPACVVFDIDGTLAIKHPTRSPYEFDKVGRDFLRLNVADLYNRFHDTPIIVCSGREHSCFRETLEWFRNHGLRTPEQILMRKTGDFRPDWKVKKEMWESIVENHYIQCIIDDRKQVVDYARSMGLDVFQVDYNNF